MVKTVGISEGFGKQLREVVRAHVSKRRGGGPGRRKPKRRGPSRVLVVLDEDLDAATDKSTSPSTAAASVYVINSDRELVDTGRNIDLVNRLEDISTPTGTFGKAEWICGEWQLYVANCN